MNNCDSCHAWAFELRSLDGFTILCKSCINRIISDKQVILANLSTSDNPASKTITMLLESKIPYVLKATGDILNMAFFGSDFSELNRNISGWNASPVESKFDKACKYERDGYYIVIEQDEGDFWKKVSVRLEMRF